MDRPTRKRKREFSDEAVITYHCPERVFKRVFRELSIEDVRHVVRSKLGLDEEATVHLAQMSDGVDIDWEDDDDFEAFRVEAQKISFLCVRVTLGRPLEEQPEPSQSNDHSHHKEQDDASLDAMQDTSITSFTPLQQSPDPSKTKKKKSKAKHSQSSSVRALDDEAVDDEPEPPKKRRKTTKGVTQQEEEVEEEPQAPSRPSLEPTGEASLSSSPIPKKKKKRKASAAKKRTASDAALDDGGDVTDPSQSDPLGEKHGDVSQAYDARPKKKLKKRSTRKVEAEPASEADAEGDSEEVDVFAPDTDLPEAPPRKTKKKTKRKDAAAAETPAPTEAPIKKIKKKRSVNRAAPDSEDALSSPDDAPTRSLSLTPTPPSGTEPISTATDDMNPKNTQIITPLTSDSPQSLLVNNLPPNARRTLSPPFETNQLCPLCAESPSHTDDWTACPVVQGGRLSVRHKIAALKAELRDVKAEFEDNEVAEESCEVESRRTTIAILRGLLADMPRKKVKKKKKKVKTPIEEDADEPVFVEEVIGGVVPEVQGRSLETWPEVPPLNDKKTSPHPPTSQVAEPSVSYKSWSSISVPRRTSTSPPISVSQSNEGLSGSGSPTITPEEIDNHKSLSASPSPPPSDTGSTSESSSVHLRIELPFADLDSIDLDALLRSTQPRISIDVLEAEELTKVNNEADDGEESDLARSTPSDIVRKRDRVSRRMSKIRLSLSPDVESEGEGGSGNEIGPQSAVHGHMRTGNRATSADSWAAPRLSTTKPTAPSISDTESEPEPEPEPIKEAAATTSSRSPSTRLSLAAMASVPDSQPSENDGERAFSVAFSDDLRPERTALANNPEENDDIVDAPAVGSFKLRSPSPDASGNEAGEFTPVQTVPFVSQPENLPALTTHSDPIEASPSSSHRPSPFKPLTHRKSTEHLEKPATPERSISPIQPASPWPQSQQQQRLDAPVVPAPTATPLRVLPPRGKRGLLVTATPQPASNVPSNDKTLSTSKRATSTRTTAVERAAKAAEKRAAKEKEKEEKLKAKDALQPDALPKKTTGRKSRAAEAPPSSQRVTRSRAVSNIPPTIHDEEEAPAKTLSMEEPASMSQLLPRWEVLPPPPSSVAGDEATQESAAVDELRSSSPPPELPPQGDELVSESENVPRHREQDETPAKDGDQDFDTPKIAPRRGLMGRLLNAFSTGPARKESPRESTLEQPQPTLLQLTQRQRSPDAASTHLSESSQGPHAANRRVSMNAIPNHPIFPPRTLMQSQPRYSLPTLKDMTPDLVRSVSNSKPIMSSQPAPSGRPRRMLAGDDDEDDDEDDEESDGDSDGTSVAASIIPASRRAGINVAKPQASPKKFSMKFDT